MTRRHEYVPAHATVPGAQGPGPGSDTGELLPDGNCIAPHRPTDLKLDLHVTAVKRSPAA
jgi:hypothetical protein